MKDELLYWYCFSYLGGALEDGKSCNASTYTGYENKKVTVARINENKKNAGVKNGATLISVSYLGRMTGKEMRED